MNSQDRHGTEPTHSSKVSNRFLCLCPLLSCFASSEASCLREYILWMNRSSPSRYWVRLPARYIRCLVLPPSSAEARFVCSANNPVSSSTCSNLLYVLHILVETCLESRNDRLIYEILSLILPRVENRRLHRPNSVLPSISLRINLFR